MVFALERISVYYDEIGADKFMARSWSIWSPEPWTPSAQALLITFSISKSLNSQLVLV
jgi:hypothetical protein